MGGDDLGSEDEYLDQSWIKFNEPVADVVEEATKTSKLNDNNNHQNDSKSRKRKKIQNHDDDDDDLSQKNKDNDEVKLKKKIKKGSMQALMLETSRNIAEKDCDVQAAFLWTCFSHAMKMSGTDMDSIEKFTPSNFCPSVKQHNSSSSSSLADYLKSGVLSSKKKLKKWKEPRSPMVLILCSSARRSVELLKEISSLNLRIAKLFPKNMKLEEQITMMKQNSFGIAIGTPNRILKLSQSSINGEMDSNNGKLGKNHAVLSLEKTELVVIDCHQDHKRYTICTLNDTAPDLMKFIGHAVVPQIQKRKTIKFAMF